MRWTVCRPDSPPLSVDADSHDVEGAHHVFRRDALVLGRPRTVVALRLPVCDVLVVRAEDGADGAGPPDDA